MAKIGRKRNVTSRERTGCVTCRARHIKCDEGRPSCQNCIRLDLECGGYPSRIIFRDQTASLRQKHGGSSPGPEKATPIQLETNQPDASKVSGAPQPQGFRASPATSWFTALVANLQTSSLQASNCSGNVEDLSTTSHLPTEAVEVRRNSQTYESAPSAALVPSSVDLPEHQHSVPDVEMEAGMESAEGGGSNRSYNANHDHEDDASHDHDDYEDPDSDEEASSARSSRRSISAGSSMAEPPPMSQPGSEPEPRPELENRPENRADEVQIQAAQGIEDIVSDHNQLHHMVYNHTRSQDAVVSINTQTSPPALSRGVASHIAPEGLMESAKFPQDIIYYHHLRDDTSTSLLSILGLEEIFKADHLDRGFFSAALALSALSVSHSHGQGQASPAEQRLAANAGLHALDHFVSALRCVRTVEDPVDASASATGSMDGGTDVGTPSMLLPTDLKLITCRLATILFLALFELQRGQMRPWYVHSRAAATFLSHHINTVRENVAGPSLIRSFSRVAALLDIYDRTYSVRPALPEPGMSLVLSEALRSSPSSSDRLLAVLPLVVKLEEDWRSDPGRESHWRIMADDLVEQLHAWYASLPSSELPDLSDADSTSPGNAGPMGITPIHFTGSRQPTKAATDMIHYLGSLVRLQTRYLSYTKVLPDNAEETVSMICRLAAGVPLCSCVRMHAYGHGMLPGLMNAYYLTDNQQCKAWIREWVAAFPAAREGIWNAKQAQRLISYVDAEYGPTGPRAGWTIIKVRMMDMDDTDPPTDDADSVRGNLYQGLDSEMSADPDKFFVEIYARHARGWSIDFVMIP
ncbi:unnamed protein product [Clonostachys byssicola]|uniref:Zn(2)-C6 fungal-type domain-containing protein n=1 Tax=Clonostachys byssicola TaxID=160290 RepID=A0A9N9U763_9HYPO|nr:unnamed protein product [Clonostachys byssicola]